MAPRREPQSPDGTSVLADAAAAGGQAGVTYPGIPTGVPDEQVAQWLQDRVNELTNALPTLEQEADNAQILMDNADQALADVRANPDPEAEAAAKKAKSEAQRAVLTANKRLRDARAAQNRYLQQQEQVLTRIAKREARDDPKAQQEHELRVKELQAQSDQNTAAQALTEKRLEWEQKKFLDENDPARLKAADDLTIAQTAAQQANTAYDTARAAAYPAESAASVAANNATAAANAATAAQTAAETAAGIPQSTAAVNNAQARASGLAADVSTEDLRQKQIGELAVLQGQLQKQVDAGTLKASDARDILQAAVDKLRTGATPYDRQNQTAANSLAFAQEAMRQGTLVNMGQPYATGAAPGEAYDQMSQALGFGSYSQTLNPTPLPRAIQNIGADVSTPYSAGQLGMPAQTPQAGGDPRAIRAAGEAAIDWSALTWQQAKTLLRGGGGATTPQVPPQTSVPVVSGGGPVPGPMGV